MKHCLFIIVLFTISMLGYSQPKLDKSVKKHFSEEQIENYKKADALYRYNLQETNPYYRIPFLYSYCYEIDEKANENPLLNLISAEILSILIDYRESTLTETEEKNASIYNNWACALFRITKAMNDFKPYGKDCLFLLEKSEKLGNQLAAFNLACYYSVKTNKKECLKWLNTMVTKKYTFGLNEINRDTLDGESDFDFIRNTLEFKAFLDKYYPVQIPLEAL